MRNAAKNSIVAYAAREVWGVQDAAKQMALASGFSVRHVRRVFNGDVPVPDKIVHVLRDEVASKLSRVKGLGKCL